MTIGVVILCRYSSSRLPGKILLPIAGKPILEHILKRVEMSGLPVVVATSIDPTDDPIADYCKVAEVQCYRGSLGNVAERFLHCAKAQSWKYATRINGDNLFVDPTLLRKMSEIAVSGEHQLITNVPGRSYPPGSSIEIVDIGTYATHYSNFVTPAHFEHVTLYLYEHPEDIQLFIYENPDKDHMTGINLAIDTEADYLQAQRISSILPQSLFTYSLIDITRAVKKL